MIPLASNIQDEFGIRRGWTELKWGGLGKEPKNQAILPVQNLESEEKGRVLSGLEIVDIKPLGLSPGTIVRLRLAGKDFQPDPEGFQMPVNYVETDAEKKDKTAKTDKKEAEKAEVKHPGIGYGKTMDLQIVTESELRADLLRREMEQTKSFKRLIKLQRDVVTDLKVLKVAKEE